MRNSVKKNFSINSKLYERLESFCEKQGIGISSLISELVEVELARIKGGDEKESSRLLMTLIRLTNEVEAVNILRNQIENLGVKNI